MNRVPSPRARSSQLTVGALCAFLLIVAPALLAVAPAAAAPTPQAVGQRVAFFEDFSSGALDPERWVLPSGWQLERARMKPWDFPTLPLNDTQFPHLSDSPFVEGARYQEAARTWAETNWIDLSTASSSAQFSLFHRWDIDPSEDSAYVMARSELRGWAVIAPIAGYPSQNGFVGSSLVFTGATFDLSSFVGSRVKLAFQVVSGTNHVTGDGWQLQSLQVVYSTAESLPDLAATELQLYDDSGGRIFSGTAGQLVELRLIVNNPGTASPPRVAPVVFYDVLPGGTRSLGRADLLPVPPSGLGRASIFVVLGPGTHTLTASIDPAGGMEELSRSNNEALTLATFDSPGGIDLVPLEFHIEAGGVPTTGARPGAGLAANITLMNLGSSGVTSHYTVGLYLRQSPNSTVLLQEQTSSIGLGAGESRTFIIGFTAIEGDLTFVASVDTGGDIDEITETNNEVERTFPVYDDPAVDLQLGVTQVLRGGVPSAEAVQGELLQVSTALRNGGTSDITEPFTVSAYLGDPDAGGTVVFTRRVAGGLLANQTIEIIGSWIAELGVRVLYMYADIGREVFETNELNNKASDTVSIRADTRVNLAVTDVEFTVFGREVDSTQVGAPVNITVTVSNLGVETDVDGFLSLSPENPWTYPSTAPIETLRLPAVIARQGQAKLTFLWTAAAGANEFFVAADYALSVSETNEFDNIAVRTITVTSDSPDLSVAPVSVRARNVETSALYPQLNVTIHSEVSNAGIEPVLNPFQVEVWAGQPGELGSVRLYRGLVPSPFDIGASVEVDVPWLVTFPSSGGQKIVVVADPNGSVVEADRTNNFAEKDVTYSSGALPNLRLETITAYRGGTAVIEAKDGETIEVRFSVVNSSPVPFTAGTLIEARDGTSLLFSAPIARLEPGDRAEFAFNWSATAGSRIRVTMNLLGEVGESDYNDNALELTLVTKKPAETPWALYGGGVAAAGVLGVILLLLVRRRGTAAHEEAEVAASDTVVAPAPTPAPEVPAGPKHCAACNEVVEADWKMCPNCGADVGEKHSDGAKAPGDPKRPEGEKAPDGEKAPEGSPPA